MQSKDSQEFVIRAAGASRSYESLILGKFPGHPDRVPNLRGASGVRAGRRNLEGGGEEWSLEGGPIQQAFRGVTDGGISGSAPSNYFVLIKQGANFVAVPVSEWVTFKPAPIRPGANLDDAEAQMKYRRMQVERANPKLAQAIGDVDTPGVGGNAAGIGGHAEEPDSDEEWKDIKSRASCAATAPAPRSGAVEAQPRGVPEEEAGVAASLYVPRPRDAEDWEHESEAADDDLEMGSGSDREAEASPAARPALSDSDGDADMDTDAAKVKKAIRRMMRETGLEESEVSDEEGVEEEEEDVDDEEDLDQMASKVLPLEKAVISSVGVTSERKRKSPPPQLVSLPTQPPVAEPEGVEDRSKRARTGDSGPPTTEEVVELLRARGRMLLKELIAEFSVRIVGTEGKKAFTEIVKQVARLEPPDDQGRKYLGLK